MKSLLTSMVLAMALLVGTAVASFAQEFTIRISSSTTNDITQNWMDGFKAGVEQRAGGRINVEAYPSGQLGPVPSTVDGVALGSIEIVALATGSFTSLEPKFQILETPGLFDSIEHAERAYLDPEVRSIFAQWGKDQGVEPLVVYAVSPLAILSNSAIHNMADFSGKKVRVPGAGAFYVEPLKLLGAAPVSMPMGEVLPALQNKTIDAVVAGPQIFTTMKFYDVTKSQTRLPDTLISAVAVANRQFLSSLGPDLEAVVREEAINAYKKTIVWNAQFNNEVAKSWSSNNGVMIDLPADEQAKYRAEAHSVIPSFYETHPELKADYERLKAAAARLR